MLLCDIFVNKLCRNWGQFFLHTKILEVHLYHQVSVMRSGVESRARNKNLSINYEGAWTVRKESERGQTTEVLKASIETERWKKKSLKI